MFRAFFVSQTLTPYTQLPFYCARFYLTSPSWTPPSKRMNVLYFRPMHEMVLSALYYVFLTFYILWAASTSAYPWFHVVSFSVSILNWIPVIDENYCYQQGQSLFLGPSSWRFLLFKSSLFAIRKTREDLEKIESWNDQGVSEGRLA